MNGLDCNVLSADKRTEGQIISSLAREMLTRPQGKGNLRHLFYPGVYIRELTVEAGAYCVGRIHKFPQINIFVKGVVWMRQSDGSFKVLRAPCTFMGPPGQKVGYVAEEMIWLNVYTTQCRDVDAIEAEYLEPSPELEEAANSDSSLILGSDDFAQMLDDLGGTPESFTAASALSPEDLLEFPLGEYKVKVGKSRIEGKGLICTCDISEGEFICHALVGGKRTPAGRFANHSGQPNSKLVVFGNNMYFVALRSIEGNRGGLDGEEITIDYRQARASAMALLETDK